VSILRWLKKAYVFTFYVMYRWAGSFGNQEWGEQNAVFLMGILQSTLLIELICGIALLTKRTPIVFSKPLVLLGLAVILLLTYFLLARKHQWSRLKPEFERYSRRQHFFASLGVGILVAAVLLGIGIVKIAIGGGARS